MPIISIRNKTTLSDYVFHRANMFGLCAGNGSSRGLGRQHGVVFQILLELINE